jgi:hypothetical protein
MESGREVPQHSSRTFLARVVKSHPSIQGSDSSSHDHFKELISISEGDITRDGDFEKHRVIANILGLAVVISVHFTQGMLIFHFFAPSC